MSTKYHINLETGRPGECSATVRDCKYAANGMVPEHYDSLDDALDAYEKVNEERTLSSLKKPSVKENDVVDAEIVEEVSLSIDDDMGDKTSKLSAPKPPPVEYQAAAPVDVIEPEKALTLVDDLSEVQNKALQKKSAEWLDTISKLNPNSQEFARHTKAISIIGKKAFESTAALSTNFLNSSSQRKNSASDRIGKDLTSIRNIVEDMAPEENTFAHKALSFLPGRNSVKKYFNRFESNAKQLDVIVKSLDQGSAQLSQENVELSLERQKLWQDLGALQKADGLLHHMDNKVVERINQEKAAGNSAMEKTLEQKVLFNIRQRRQDVATQTAVTIQSYMAMGMIEENNERLQQNIERTKTTTATALATSARIAEALGHQKNVIEGIEIVRNTTNKMIANNANQLKQNTLKIQEQATSTSVDTQVLSDAFTNMFETLDNMDNFRSQANDNFLTTINALGEQVNRANQYAAERNRRVAAELNSSDEKLLLND